MDGQQVQDAAEIADGQAYIAAGQEPFHHCQYGHNLPRLQIGTARKKASSDEEDEEYEEEDEEEEENAAEYTIPRTLPPLNRHRETESQRIRRQLEHQLQDKENTSDQATDAAIKIQAGYRGFKVRKERKRRELAACKIQASFRGYHTRKHLAKRDTNELVLDNTTSPGPPPTTPIMMMGRILEEPNNNRCDERFDADLAATKIQAGFRGYKARKKINEINHAAAKIQAGFRGYKTRKVVKEERERQIEAATKIQAGFRGYKTRKERKTPSKQPEEPAEDDQVKKAATKIQANYRGYRVRKQFKKQQEPDQEEDEEEPEDRPNPPERTFTDSSRDRTELVAEREATCASTDVADVLVQQESEQTMTENSASTVHSAIADVQVDRESTNQSQFEEDLGDFE